MQLGPEDRRGPSGNVATLWDEAQSKQNAFHALTQNMLSYGRALTP